MRTIKYLAILALTIGSLSCVWSLQPLFEEKDLVFEPGLVGTWKTVDDVDTWTFEKAREGNGYVLVHHQAEYRPGGSLQDKNPVPGDTVRFQARLGRLGSRLFLDLIPEEKDNPWVHNDLFNWHLIRAHTICRVSLAKAELRLDWLDEDWLKEAMRSGKITIAHAPAEDGLVVTAPTEELQQLVLKYADDQDAFPPSEDVLQRVK
jgi:hypothetical protein